MKTLNVKRYKRNEGFLGMALAVSVKCCTFAIVIQVSLEGRIVNY